LLFSLKIKQRVSIIYSTGWSVVLSWGGGAEVLIDHTTPLLPV